MRKIRKIINKPRNIYYCLIAMLTVVVGLVSISFSYYISESGNNVRSLSLSVVDNQIKCDSLKNGVLKVAPNETVTFSLYVMSNNNFESSFKLFYKADTDNLKVYAEKLKDSIGAYDIQSVDITVINYTNEEQSIEFGIANGYLNTEIETDGIVIANR